jgi:hypothetical protein
MDPSVWEAAFFLLLLKIPVVFVGVVVWRAIKATPIDPGETDSVRVAPPVPDTPVAPSRRRRGPHRPAAGPRRRPPSQRPTGTRTLGSR